MQYIKALLTLVRGLFFFMYLIVRVLGLGQA